MSTLMQHEQHGWHYATGGEIEPMKLNGWKIVEKMIDPADHVTEPVTEPVVEAPIHPQAEKPRLGRPPKNVVENDLGNSTDPRR